MLTKIVQKLQSLTMKSQILLFNVVTLVAVLSIVWINYYVQTEIFSAISSSSLSQILQTQDQDQIGFIAQNVAVIIELKFFTVLQQIEQIKQFYNFFELEKHNIVNNKKMNPCISMKEIIMDKRVFSTQRFCYQAIGVPDYISIPQNEKEVVILHDFISFLNHYSLVINVPFTGKLQIASISQTKYFAQFPTAILSPSYDITKRFWYENHILKTKADSNTGFVFSPLNEAFASQIKEMSITNSIYKADQMIGIIKEGLLVSNKLIPTVPYNVLLLDQDGLVVYFNMEQLINKTDYFYIYQENITGFNKTDWEEMIEFSNRREKVILVLENKLQQEKVNIYSLEVLKNNFTLIVYTNITTKIDNKNKSEEIREKSFFNFTISLFIQIFLGFAAIILQIIVLLVVFKPLKQFYQIIKQYTLSQGNNINCEIFKLINKKPQESNAITTLQNKILNFSQILSESQGRKCEMCKIWESFQYNLNDSEFDFDFDQFKKQFRYLENGKQQYKNKMLKIIKLGIN